MFKKFVFNIVLISFLAFLITPAIIVIVDDSIDISLFSGFAKEKEGEKNIEIEGLFHCLNEKEIEFTSVFDKNRSCYFFKKYPKPYLNIIFPPPDFIF